MGEVLALQEHPNSDRWHQHKKPGTIAHACHPRAGRQRQEDLWEMARPGSLAELESSRFSEGFKVEALEDNTAADLRPLHSPPTPPPSAPPAT